MKKLLISIAASFFVAFATYAADNFATVQLTMGINVDLPKNWIVMSQDHMMTIDASAQSVGTELGIFNASSNLAFGAGYIFEGDSAALFNIRYYPEVDVSQSDARSLSRLDINEFDELLEKGIRESGKLSGYSVSEWLGTSEKEINGFTAMISRYLRKSDNDTEDFNVRLVRVFDEQKSFTITISYRESLGGVLRPICDHVIGSIQINQPEKKRKTTEETSEEESENVLADFKVCRVTSDDSEVNLTIAGGPLSKKQFESLLGDMENIQNLPISPNRVLLGQTILKPSDEFTSGIYLQTLIPLMARIDLDATDTVKLNFFGENGSVVFEFDVIMLNDEATMLQLSSDTSPKELLKFLYGREEQTLFSLIDRNGQVLVGRLFTNKSLKEAFAIGDRQLGRASFTPSGK
jgi:hypothetical protein